MRSNIERQLRHLSIPKQSVRMQADCLKIMVGLLKASVHHRTSVAALRCCTSAAMTYHQVSKQAVTCTRSFMESSSLRSKTPCVSLASNMVAMKTSTAQQIEKQAESVQSLGRRDAPKRMWRPLSRRCHSQVMNAEHISAFQFMRQSQLPCHFEILAMCSPRGSSENLCPSELSRTMPANVGKQGSA